jgi:PAS domain S-box-containing protein
MAAGSAISAVSAAMSAMSVMSVIFATCAVVALALACFAWLRVRSLRELLRRAEAQAALLARRNQELADERIERGERSLAQQDRDAFFSVALDLLAILGFDGYFKQLNLTWEQVLGLPLTELKSRPTIELVHPEDRDSTLSEWQRLRIGGGSVDFENRWLGSDGLYRWLSWRATSIPGAERIYAVARDVSERKKLDQIKSDFVSVVSHELRTPLTSIRGSLGLLAGGVAGEIAEPARGLIEIAAKNSDRLVRLINDILDVEKVESGSMHFRFQLVDLAALIAQAVESNQAYAQPFNVRFVVIQPLPEVRVRADPDRLLQVLANLLSNAAKFSPRGGQVEIAVTVENGRVAVAVTDHGKGIPPDFHHRVFERFAQADASSTRQKGGTGLGLSIAKAIVERHGGHIGFETRPEAGTTFTFDLAEWGGETALAAGSLAGARILICEDDPDLALELRHTLEREGCQIDVAGTAVDAKRLLAGNSYSAMTLDLLLPDQDGLSLVRELRLDARTSGMPVVVVSAWGGEERDERIGETLGVLEWLVKPVDPARLLTAVRRAVRGSLHEGPVASSK